MSNAYDNANILNEISRCGCGAGLLPYPVNVVHAETGRLVTRFCHRCAADLMAAGPAAGGGRRRAARRSGEETSCSGD